jgi:hypothetical protein
MFQFSYKLKVSERVKAKCERHPRYNPERKDEEASRADALPVSLSSTSTRHGYRSTPHTVSF